MSQEFGPRLVNDEAYLQYESSALNVNGRRVIYDKYAVPEIGLFDPANPEKGNWGIEFEIIKSLQELGYTGTQRLGDIGCGDGRFVERLVDAGHVGEIWGMNLPGDLYYPAELALKDNPSVHFTESRAEKLVLPDGAQVPDGYFDIVTENSLLYHLDDYTAAIDEAYRVLAPGGLLVVTTKKDGNQEKIWGLAGNEVRQALEGITAAGRTEENYMGILPPQSFYSHFDFKIENKVLPEHGFEHTGKKLRHFGELQIPYTDEGWEDLKFAIFSLKDAYRLHVPGYANVFAPIHASDMMTAIELGAKPVFDEKGQKRGYFKDRVKMGFDIWQKPLAA